MIFTNELACLFAQESINTSGGEATGAGGSLSYSVGQVVYSTYTGTVGSISEGVQQPYEISGVIGIEESVGAKFFSLIYPTLTADYLILEVKNFGHSKLKYQLYDINGKLLSHSKIEEIETRILMRNLIPATYFLKLSSENKDLGTYKIIKN